MRVVWIDFHNHDKDWVPDDCWDCEMWATVDVGDETGAASFQVHVCTHTAVTRLDDKRHCFLIDEYLGLQSLVDRLDKFISQTVHSIPGDPYRELGRVWLWEYGKYDQRGRLIG